MRLIIGVLMGALLSFVPACGGDDKADDDEGPGGGSAICERGCVATLAANCPTGPTDQASCVSTCQTLSTGSCKTEYGAFQTCADGKAITCGSSGIPVVEECAAEQDAFIACLTP